jgi:hypothetical protein
MVGSSLVPGLALVAALSLGGVSVLAAKAAEAERAPVVLELFTSQGCSSCPAADAFLGELAAREDVLALSMHVDYWNYIGWVDPFASEAITRRQKAYMHKLGARYVYTPQLVVDGREHLVGSDRSAVESAIDEAKKAPGPHLRVGLSYAKDGRITVRIPASDRAETATVLVVAFDRVHETAVTEGENIGRTILNYHVVRALTPVGRYDGTATEIVFDEASALPDFEADACAVLLQSERSGAIIGAGQAWMPGPQAGS